jgi:hypothetical protein
MTVADQCMFRVGDRVRDKGPRHEVGTITEVRVPTDGPRIALIVFNGRGHPFSTWRYFGEIEHIE